MLTKRFEHFTKANKMVLQVVAIVTTEHWGGSATLLYVSQGLPFCLSMTYQHSWTIHVHHVQNVKLRLGNLVESPGPVYPRLQPVSDTTIPALKG